MNRGPGQGQDQHRAGGANACHFSVALGGTDLVLSNHRDSYDPTHLREYLSRLGLDHEAISFVDNDRNVRVGGISR